MVKKINRRSFLLGGLATCAVTTTSISHVLAKNYIDMSSGPKETVDSIHSSKLREADKAEITILVDNYTDTFLQDSGPVKRARIPPPDGLSGEPGFSCLIKVSSGTESHTILFDGGISYNCLQKNMGILGIESADIESVVLSHGHYDHFGGLYNFFKRTKQSIPLIVHPDAFLERRYNRIFTKVDMTRLEEKSLTANGAIIRKRKGVSTIAKGLALVSGNVKRRTKFEIGFPAMEAKIDGRWISDPFNDDQAMAIHLKNRGLIVIGGCSHAGIINTVEYCRKMSEVEKVHAVMGGFHLTGPAFEQIVHPTIEAMKKINPDYVAPLHCTGWKAINSFAQEMPNKFLLGCVGTTYQFS